MKIKESSHNLLSNCSLITFAPKTTSALQAKIEDALEAFAAEINKRGMHAEENFR